MGLPDGDQGRRHRRQGGRDREQAPEHGRADGEGGRLQDLRRRRRRHHHRDRARAGDLQRGRQARRRGPQPDGPQAWHRGVGRGDHRQAQGDVGRDQGQEGHRPGRHDLGQRRRDHRRDDRRRDGQGRQGRRHHGRGGQDADQRARRRRGYAVRPRLPVAVLRHRRRAHGGRAERRLRAHPREEDLEHEGAAPAPRAGRQAGPPAAHHRRGRGRRGARHAGRQQAARHAPRVRGQGAGLR